MSEDRIRADYRIIAELVAKNTSVLDLGCGDGGLLSYLADTRGVRARGIELNDEAVLSCVKRGLSVSQQDIDAGLSEYGDASFDYVILNQCMQQVKLPHTAIGEAVRVGRQAIIGFPNFAHISSRWQLGVLGRAPVTPSLPYQWYNTPNRHFLGISDFKRYCEANGYLIEQERYLNDEKRVRFMPGLLAQTGIFVIHRRK
ncbi:MAG: methionine biosynthesis protein MetW [Dehalococcoidia bacterium]|nr:methionine biosynthesis protein MetW [Dehalococcoidia bacterium]